MKKCIHLIGVGVDYEGFIRFYTDISEKLNPQKDYRFEFCPRCGEKLEEEETK